ncbi:MAG TPA: hypothetical protein PK176_08560 [Acidobacteriota bacterium]|nr:hypothetical protein [Acidobacteriota bacterium]HQM63353.1 hypothetical protein [Acidobacteriota bacterium]
MRRWTGCFMLVLAVCVGWAAAGELSAPKRLTFVIQQDADPAMTSLNFNKGFAELLKWLPSDCQVSIFGFYGNTVYPVRHGKAGELDWPSKGMDFLAINQNAVPFKDLLAILAHWRIQDQPVCFISNCRCLAMFQSMQLEGTNVDKHVNIKPSVVSAVEKPVIMDQQDFDPKRYEPLAKLNRYLKENKIRLYGFYVRKNTEKDLFAEDDRTGSSFFTGDMRYFQNRQISRDLMLDSLGLTALHWLTIESGGVLYYDFPSFSGVFRSLDKK